MARKRMLSQSVVDSDTFMELSLPAQCLYFHLSMRADDEGFVQNPKMIMRCLNCTIHHAEELQKAGYLFIFPDGVYLLVHWFINNDIRKDRMQKSICVDDRSKVTISNGIYQLCERRINAATSEAHDSNDAASCQADASTEAVQYSIDQYSIDKSSIVQYSTLPLKNGTEFVATPEMVEKWRGKYPDSDLSKAFQGMRDWLLQHPQKQREAEKMPTFIENWLNNAQKPYGGRCNDHARAEQSFGQIPNTGITV